MDVRALMLRREYMESGDKSPDKKDAKQLAGFST